MNKLQYFFLCLLSVSLLLQACKEAPLTEPKDLDNPEVTLAWPPEMAVGQYLPKNNQDTLSIKASFSDDFALAQYVVTIRYRTELDYMDYLKTNDFPWSETWYGDLEGESGQVSIPITIVWNPSVGPYEVKVVVRDEAGRADSASSYLYVSSSLDRTPPNVTLSAPNTGSVDTFAIGTWIPVSISASDSKGLEDVFVRVRDDYTNATLEGSEILWEGIPASVSADTQIYIPAGTVPGDYWVEGYAHDSIRNVNSDRAHIFIRTN